MQNCEEKRHKKKRRNAIEGTGKSKKQVQKEVRIRALRLYDEVHSQIHHRLLGNHEEEVDLVEVALRETKSVIYPFRTLARVSFFIPS